MDESTIMAKNFQVASRWKRLWASLIDTIIMMIIVFPIMYFTGAFENIAQGYQPSMGYNIAMGFVGLIVFALINFKLLISNGQTVGKKILNIKIITLEGDLPDFNNHILKRYLVYFLPAQLLIVGQIFSFVNILFIFGKQKRCIHDFVAGTKVIAS